MCHAVFATSPLRHSPKLRFRCHRDERVLVIFFFSPSSFPPQPLHIVSGFHREGICQPEGICCISGKCPALHFTCSFFSFFQIFEGNSNYDTPELRTVEPLLTRFIRIYPERATPAGMGLRLELLGCEIEGKLN